MTLNYIPILKAKAGEFEAISHFSDQDLEKFVPLFEIPVLDESKKQRLIKENKLPVISFLDSVLDGIAESFSGRKFFIDFSYWPTDSQVESGEHIILHVFNRLIARGKQSNPVIDYDSWDDPSYASAFKSMQLFEDNQLCIRFHMNADTIEEIYSDPIYLNIGIENILGELSIPPQKIVLLIDFSDLSSDKITIPDVAEHVIQTVNIFQEQNFGQTFMAGCSLPVFISDAVPKPNSTGLSIRKEMVAWQAILQRNPHLNIGFADYAVRNPSSNEFGYGNTNGKIRYTIDKHFFIVRGHQLKTGDKGAQYYHLSDKLINSRYYLGRNFSWGDEQVYHCSQKKFKGRSQDWIAIDTNHHIKTVLLELYEAQREAQRELTTTA